MEGLEKGIFGDPDAERLAALREQRMLLRGLRDEVDLAVGAVAAADLGDSWRSAAHRGYAERLSDLGGDLRRARRELDVALDAVHASISRLTAPG